MKIHLKGKPQQFAWISVTCLDSLMLEMLTNRPNFAGPFPTMQDIMFLRTQQPAGNNFFYRFHGGSFLYVADQPNTYFIHGVVPGGLDILSAIEELKMMDAIRIAHKHFAEMKKLFVGMDHLSLRSVITL